VIILKKKKFYWPTRVWWGKVWGVEREPRDPWTWGIKNGRVWERGKKSKNEKCGAEDGLTMATQGWGGLGPCDPTGGQRERSREEKGDPV